MDIFEFITKGTVFIPYATFLLKAITTMVTYKKCTPKYAMLYKQHITKETSIINGLSIDYNGTKIDELAITTFIFWNSGKIGLKKDSYGSVRPYIGCNDAVRILGYEIRLVYDPAFVNLNVELEDNKLHLTFDEIIRNQGFVIDIIHTGKSNKDLIFVTNFKNAKAKRKCIFHKLHTSILDKIPRSLFWLFALIFIVIAAICNTVTGNFSIKVILYSLFSIVIVLIGFVLHLRENYAPYWGVPLKLQAPIKESDNK